MILSINTTKKGLSVTFEECLKSAAKFSIYKDWRNADPKAVAISKKKYWYNRITTHMTDGRSRWNLVSCLFDSMRFDNVAQWRQHSPTAYSFAQRKGWLKLCVSYYGPKITLDDCRFDAQLYESRSEWQSKGRHYYYAASNGWLDVCCSHMQFVDSRKWTVQACLDDAKRYSSRYEWFLASKSGYAPAKRLGVFEECVKCFAEPIQVLKAAA